MSRLAVDRHVVRQCCTIIIITINENTIMIDDNIVKIMPVIVKKLRFVTILLFSTKIKVMRMKQQFFFIPKRRFHECIKKKTKLMSQA